MADPKVTVVFRLKDQASKGFSRIRQAAGNLLSSPLFRFASFGGLLLGLKKSTEAADAFAASQIKLRGIAKITGVDISFLTKVSRDAEKQFKLSKVQANEFASEIAKLTGKAGDLNLTADALSAFLNIGAARGLTAAQTLQAVRQAILGIDEGTDKLFDKNPSVLYKEYADRIGTTAGKLTDQQKAQAIVTAAMRDANKVGNAYNEFLDTAAGKQQVLANETENFGATLGEFVNTLRVLVIPPLTKLIGHLTEGLRIIKLIRTEANAFEGARDTTDLAGEQERLRREARSLERQIRDREAGPRTRRIFGVIPFGTSEAQENERQLALLQEQLDATNAALSEVNRRIRAGGSAPSAGGGVGGGGAGGGFDVNAAADRVLGTNVPQLANQGTATLRTDIETPDLASTLAATENLAEAANAAGAAFAGAFGDAVFGAETTEDAVKQIAGTLAREQLAKGVAKLAEGIFPPNPLALASASKHFAAAGLFKTLGGGGGGGGGGGVPASSGLNPSTYQRDSAALSDRGTVEVNLKRGYAETGSAAFQDFIADTVRRAGGRGVRINYTGTAG